VINISKSVIERSQVATWNEAYVMTMLRLLKYGFECR